ncbi:hypothetical protein FZEAL_612 [Fusarium zealandicum]|uniref:Uncharacterized protein n=1 Tax=Fusarium zealandicum TaxID=1053134 RepID=A0A8H4UUC6_9HYPO|nr:hypothetical protein FZEAL_612 [Fusarium zealandicum]
MSNESKHNDAGTSNNTKLDAASVSVSASASSSAPQMPDVAPPSFEESMAADPGCFRTRFACISFNESDRIRLISFSEREIAAVQEVITTRWSRGISSMRTYAGSHEFRVYGSPWDYSLNGNDDARRLVLRILERLYDMGWVLHGAMDATTKSTSKGRPTALLTYIQPENVTLTFPADSLVFRKQDPVPPPCDWISISFDGASKVKIVDAPPEDLVAAIVKGFGGEIYSQELTADRLKLKFKGMPWSPSSEETVRSRLKLLFLLKTLEHVGFTLYATVGARYVGDKGSADVLVCQRQKGWVPGAPIWHR